ncbi:hypothetical protein SAMN05216601_105151 [Ectopseudomonas composti]|uniref:Uncharacterized protein n=1 Tax=Ectopseudomonas composti TaxID=658457 RepID=A0A1I5MEX7_9GAMM|nr:hypothetical protein [Pseudomonas composti]SFP08144.1 hypothetical protein SAMN05216601_105151 [Pseudomonas composti]
MELLEHDYPGDETWDNYVDLYREDYNDAKASILAQRLDGHDDIAVVIYGKRGLEEGLWWVEQQVPALDGLRPDACLTDPILLKRLKTALMRMP